MKKMRLIKDPSKSTLLYNVPNATDSMALGKSLDLTKPPFHCLKYSL